MVAFRDGYAGYGFGAELIPFSSTLPFTVDYRGARPKPGAPLDLAHEVCWHIHDTMPGPISIMVSGGVDSQSTAYAFKTSGVPNVRYFACRFTGGFNDHDYDTVDFYAENGIELEWLDLDIVAFHHDELYNWGERFTCTSPHFITHMKIASMMPEGTIVSSGCVVTQNPVTLGSMTYSGFGLHRYSEITNTPMVGYFFNYDPSLVHAIWSLAKTLPHNPNAYAFKCSVYREAGFPVRPQMMKYHGFEKLKLAFDETIIPITTRMRFKDMPSKRPYDLLFRYPLTRLFKYSDREAVIYPE